MRKMIFTLASILVFSSIQAQTPIIFQPGPGSNDSTDQGGINGGKDTYSAQYYPENNYGSLYAMASSPISTCNTWLDIAYIQFDLSTLPLDVDSVFVGFTHFPDTANTCLSGCYADFYFAAINQPWYEMTLTNINKPTFDTAFYGPVNITYPNNFGTREYNITAMYNLWKAETIVNYGMAIYSPTTACDNVAVEFTVHTSDDTIAVNRPYLKIYPHAIGTGIQYEVNNESFLLYPNPAKDIAYAEFILPQSSNVFFRLTDMTGRTISSSEQYATGGITTRIPVKLSNLPQGLYIYNVLTPGKSYKGMLVHQ